MTPAERIQRQELLDQVPYFDETYRLSHVLQYLKIFYPEDSARYDKAIEICEEYDRLMIEALKEAGFSEYATAYKKGCYRKLIKE